MALAAALVAAQPSQPSGAPEQQGPPPAGGNGTCDASAAGNCCSAPSSFACESGGTRGRFLSVPPPRATACRIQPARTAARLHSHCPSARLSPVCSRIYCGLVRQRLGSAGRGCPRPLARADARVAGQRCSRLHVAVLRERVLCRRHGSQQPWRRLWRCSHGPARRQRHVQGRSDSRMCLLWPRHQAPVRRPARRQRLRPHRRCPRPRGRCTVPCRTRRGLQPLHRVADDHTHDRRSRRAHGTGGRAAPCWWPRWCWR